MFWGSGGRGERLWSRRSSPTKQGVLLLAKSVLAGWTCFGFASLALTPRADSCFRSALYSDVSPVQTMFGRLWAGSSLGRCRFTCASKNLRSAVHPLMPLRSGNPPIIRNAKASGPRLCSSVVAVDIAMSPRHELAVRPIRRGCGRHSPVLTPGSSEDGLASDRLMTASADFDSIRNSSFFRVDACMS